MGKASVWTVSLSLLGETESESWAAKSEKPWILMDLKEQSWML